MRSSVCETRARCRRWGRFANSGGTCPPAASLSVSMASHSLSPAGRPPRSSGSAGTRWCGPGRAVCGSGSGPGFQYEPVASIAIVVTPSAANQSAIASYDPVNEANVRVRLRRPGPLNAGVRTHATTSSFPMSIPAHRSSSTSTGDLLVVDHHRAGPAGPSDQRRCEACTKTTVRGAGKAPGVSLRTGFSRTERERAQPTPNRFSSAEAVRGRAMERQK